MKKEKLKEIRALLFTISLALASTGCTKKYEPVGFEIQGTDAPNRIHNDGVYTYLLNKHEFDMDNICPYANTSDITFLREAEVGSIYYLYEEQLADDLIRDKFFYYKLSDYGLIKNYINKKYFSFKYNKRVFKEFNGGLFSLVHCEIIAKKNLTIGDIIISKGDKLESESLFFEEQMIGFKQIASGSLRNIISEKKVGNIDTGLVEVDGNILDESLDIRTREMRDLLRYINDENHNANTLKKDLYKIIAK